MMQRYAKAYFGKAGKAQPVIHTMLLVGGLGYLIEYPHLKHEQDAARAAAKGEHH